ncbi:MAG: carboxypeptidase-like regulatory domain-containing protein, partial [Vicinamibacterales bacterium]
MRGYLAVLGALAGSVLLSTAAFAQGGSIAGVVRDTSGAVLPGVTVEAASPALIERVRSAVTDGSGQYRIVDLRPGTYTVTATLTGFNTFKRDGIDVSGSGVFTINAELKVGAIEESVTVSGETPVVDLQSTTRERVMSKDVIDALPTGRTYFALGVLVPGVNSTG